MSRSAPPSSNVAKEKREVKRAAYFARDFSRPARRAQFEPSPRDTTRAHPRRRILSREIGAEHGSRDEQRSRHRGSCIHAHVSEQACEARAITPLPFQEQFREVADSDDRLSRLPRAIRRAHGARYDQQRPEKAMADRRRLRAPCAVRCTAGAQSTCCHDESRQRRVAAASQSAR